tara:strand:- start:130 stop:390 length:261 start_codon:yes stop_codon:yes gene_type:complete
MSDGMRVPSDGRVDHLNRYSFTDWRGTDSTSPLYPGSSFFSSLPFAKIDHVSEKATTKLDHFLTLGSHHKVFKDRSEKTKAETVKT